MKMMNMMIEKSVLKLKTALMQVLCMSIVIVCTSACRNDRLPAEVNGGHVSLTSEEKNEQFAYEEAERAVAEGTITQEEFNSMDAPSEGLQQVPYENIEQPDALIGVSEVILFKSQFIISYNVETHCPNYVCWSLDRGRLRGDAQRTDKFNFDPALSENARVDYYDYNGSGYDRGHMCPAGDNKNSMKAMEESFLMTNICPQNHALNSGAWNDLEMQCRQWAKDYGTVYICCGPIFDSKNPRTIGKRKDMKVAVPDRFFKVLLTMGKEPKAIGFIYPNANTNKDIRDYAVSVDEVEKITGMDFFYQLDNKQEKAIESVCKPAQWGI